MDCSLHFSRTVYEIPYGSVKYNLFWVMLLLDQFPAAPLLLPSQLPLNWLITSPKSGPNEPTRQPLGFCTQFREYTQAFKVCLQVLVCIC